MFIYTLAFIFKKMPSSILIRNNSSVVKFIYGAISHNSSGIRVYRSDKSGLFKKTIKKIGRHPDIFGPHHDCGACGGGGCSRCS